ncbi:hypothetical protein SPRG_01552 [Saprolegnia parasitica CBS 223.65]|uniref:EF-hand domain-containing protein n=1 Tax=Saprolegnia parasitica (strain CBS 223.65) TaxID=695850 RepID=A0A067D5X5_SAPPC|nr:hypothetical protein SPRG_01552 [Saprolegnia parasitica CBS 223.65]KDO34417.1 hypothetical protein SPRG_01552 [Saprolegnia parasitica CBS 223.65]|eukprot:XP_012195149.1 hypothetical protein SPRG_01552 [Saprolegnia parasitica CBS 223.65]
MVEPMVEPEASEWDMILGDVPVFQAHPAAFADVRRLLAAQPSEEAQYETVQVLMGLLEPESARAIVEDADSKALLAAYFKALSKSTVAALVSQLPADVQALLPRRKSTKKLSSKHSSDSMNDVAPAYVPRGPPMAAEDPIPAYVPRGPPVAIAEVAAPIVDVVVSPTPPVVRQPSATVALDVRPEWEVILGECRFFEANPSVFRDVRDAIESQPASAQYEVMHALVSLVDGSSGDDPDHVIAAAPIVKSLSKSSQELLATGLSSTLQQLLPFLDKVPLDMLPSMLPPTLLLMEESARGQIYPETAAAVHESFFTLPEKVRSQVINALPPEEKNMVQTLVETTEGLSTREVAVVIQQMQAPSAPGSAPHSYDDPGFLKELALSASKAHGRRLCRWVQSAPTSLRVLSFVNGVLLLSASAIAFLFDLFSGYWLVFLINAWILAFAVVLIVLEIKLSFFEMKVLPFVVRQVPLLGTVFGRGVFMVFVGFLAMSLVLHATWQNLLLCGAGLLSALLGSATMLLSALASHEFFLLCRAIPTQDAWAKAFISVDVDDSGELDMDEFMLLCDRLGSRIDAVYIESIFRDIDTDKSNTLSLPELLNWWSRAKLHDAPTPPAKSVVHVPSSVLKKANIGVSCLTVLTGVLSNVAAMHDSTSSSASPIYVVLNLWVILFGLLMVVVETPLHLFRDARIWITDNIVQFLASIFGRAAFYLFIGTFTLSLYQADAMVLPLVTGSLLIVMAGVNLYVGYQAKVPFRQLAQYVQPKDVEAIFAMHDHDMDGNWSLVELKSFIESLGLDVKPLFWELLVDNIDHDHSGMVSVTEFESWVVRHRGETASVTTHHAHADDVYDAEPIAV